MKISPIPFLALAGMLSFNAAAAENEMMQIGKHHDMSIIDTRISLNESPQMKQHQLSLMRGHVEAVRTIIGLMAEGKLEAASKTAHDRLGLTPEMKMMCGMFNNANFEQLGLAFHKSGDELGDALHTGDVNASLRALNNTMQYCVECHATYRQ
jgi:hypothetical protein